MTRSIQLYDGITGEQLADVPYPTGGRLRIRATGIPEGAQPTSGYGSLDSTWLEMDGVTARGMRVSLKGSDVRNLIIDCEGSDVSGAQFLMDGAILLNTRVQARAIDDPTQLVVDTEG